MKSESVEVREFLKFQWLIMTSHTFQLKTNITEQTNFSEIELILQS